MSVKSLTDLPGLKEEHLAQLAEMGIASVADMKKALADDAKAKEMVKTLSGVGPKTVDKWRTELEGVSEKAKPAEAEAKPSEKKETKPVEVVEVKADDEYIVKAKPELDEETKDALVQRFYDYMNPGAYLLIGHSETLNKANSPFEYLMPATYRKV